MEEVKGITMKYRIVRKKELTHSAKGSTWKDHKYIKKVGDKYVYANSKNGTEDTDTGESSGGSSDQTNTSGNNSENTGNTESGFDIEEMANKVIRGEFGNGADRKELLGDSYAEIQKRVNEILKGNSKSTAKTVSKKDVKKGNDHVNKLLSDPGFARLPVDQKTKVLDKAKK